MALSGCYTKMVVVERIDEADRYENRQVVTDENPQNPTTEEDNIVVSRYEDDNYYGSDYYYDDYSYYRPYSYSFYFDAFFGPWSWRPHHSYYDGYHYSGYGWNRPYGWYYDSYWCPTYYGYYGGYRNHYGYPYAYGYGGGYNHGFYSTWNEEGGRRTGNGAFRTRGRTGLDVVAYDNNNGANTAGSRGVLGIVPSAPRNTSQGVSESGSRVGRRSGSSEPASVGSRPTAGGYSAPNAPTRSGSTYESGTNRRSRGAASGGYSAPSTSTSTGNGSASSGSGDQHGGRARNGSGSANNNPQPPSRPTYDQPSRRRGDAGGAAPAPPRSSGGSGNAPSRSGGEDRRGRERAGSSDSPRYTPAPPRSESPRSEPARDNGGSRDSGGSSSSGSRRRGGN